MNNSTATFIVGLAIVIGALCVYKKYGTGTLYKLASSDPNSFAVRSDPLPCGGPVYKPFGAWYVRSEML